MTNNSDILKDLLIADYQYRAEALRKSEESGETRINIFVGLATVLLGIIVSLSTQNNKPADETMRLIIVGVLLGLILLGIMTLFRLVIRNKHTDDCKRDLDHIRQTFKDSFDNDNLLLDYYPVSGYPIFRNLQDRTNNDLNLAKNVGRWFGGLAHLMCMINTVLMTVFFGFLFLFYGLPNATPITIISISIFVGILTFVAQLTYVNQRKKEAKAEREAKAITHAGGVVYRITSGQPEYLLITSARVDNEEWVLPKGYIEAGESHVEAAIREIQEEANIATRRVCLLDIVEYEYNSELVRVKYYLMEFLFEMTWKKLDEKRQHEWLLFEPAIAKITYPEGKHLLSLANHKLLNLKP